MKKIIFILSLFFTLPVYAQLYGERICKQPEYTCHKVKSGESWERLFPNANQRDVARRLNRMNIPLRPGMVIAVPKRSMSVMEISPFPRQAPATGSNVVKVDQSQLAWGAYDAQGRLVKWGPMSGGKNYCPDVKRGCKTITGEFTVYRTQGEGCRSSKYPRPHGGARMPYCMHFFKGYALHGSTKVPGKHDSHGCVRLFIEDAKWLNHNFVTRGLTKVKVFR